MLPYKGLMLVAALLLACTSAAPKTRDAPQGSADLADSVAPFDPAKDLDPDGFKVDLPPLPPAPTFLRNKRDTAKEKSHAAPDKPQEEKHPASKEPELIFNDDDYKVDNPFSTPKPPAFLQQRSRRDSEHLKRAQRDTKEKKKPAAGAPAKSQEAKAAAPKLPEAPAVAAPKAPEAPAVAAPKAPEAAEVVSASHQPAAKEEHRELKFNEDDYPVHVGFTLPDHPSFLKRKFRQAPEDNGKSETQDKPKKRKKTKQGLEQINKKQGTVKDPSKKKQKGRKSNAAAAAATDLNNKKQINEQAAASDNRPVQSQISSDSNNKEMLPKEQDSNKSKSGKSGSKKGNMRGKMRPGDPNFGGGAPEKEEKRGSKDGGEEVTDSPWGIGKVEDAAPSQ